MRSTQRKQVPHNGRTCLRCVLELCQEPASLDAGIGMRGKVGGEVVMHNAAWVKLLRHIPASEQANLMLVTTCGTEIAIQCLLRLDPECLALRGRLAGSTDAGRVFFVPYSHIDYFGFQQPLKEAEFHELFNNLELLGPAAPLNPAATAVPPQPSPSPPSSPVPVAPSRSPLTIKSTVLEKFRSRSTTNPGTQMRPPLDE